MKSFDRTTMVPPVLSSHTRALTRRYGSFVQAKKKKILYTMWNPLAERRYRLPALYTHRIFLPVTFKLGRKKASKAWNPFTVYTETPPQYQTLIHASRRNRKPPKYQPLHIRAKKNTKPPSYETLTNGSRQNEEAWMVSWNPQPI